MSVDERLREGLRPHAELVQPAELTRLFGDLERRVQGRKRRRAALVGGFAVAACLVSAVVVPRVVAESTSHREPVDSPTVTTTTADGWRPADTATPIDGRDWASEILAKDDRLAALDGTGLENLGAAVFDRARFANRASSVSFWQGEVVVRRATLTHAEPTLSTTGTFVVRGHHVVIELLGHDGATTLRWSRPDPDALVLEFVDSEVDQMYGAPTEVFWRLWTATPFVDRLSG